MKPCKAFGHTEGRYASGHCKACQKLRNDAAYVPIRAANAAKRLTARMAVEQRPCKDCGVRPRKKKSPGSPFKQGRFHSYCSPCGNKRGKKQRYKLAKGDRCVRCGFVAEHPAQLEVDHILPKWRGGTDDAENLQTICANCHRLKTMKESEAREQLKLARKMGVEAA